MPSRALKILLAASEIVPFAKTGGLADVAGSLPKALRELGHDVRLAIPKYRLVTNNGIESKPVIDVLTVPLNGGTTVSIESSDAIERVTTYLVRHDPSFDRDGLYGHPDDALRFAIYQQAVLKMMSALDWRPDVFHGNDWQTALIPLYAGLDSRFPESLPSLYTIHNLAYQGSFPSELVPELGLPWTTFTLDGLEYYGAINMMKAGIVYSDLVSTVSERYAQEIQTPEFGAGLEGVLAQRKDDLIGILNGIDGEEWDPATDGAIAERFDLDSRRRKAANRTALRAELGLTDDPRAPLIGIIGRLAAQKGFDLLAEVAPHALGLDTQLVVLGTGDKMYHDLFSALAKRHPDRMAVRLEFNDALARRIYAGSDMFLMPSRYEPCGLGQMISLRYGSIPIVRATGGLADTVTEFDPATRNGNGFSFDDYSGVALFAALARALMVYRNSRLWDRLIRNAMKCDFSWRVSAKKYVAAYREAIARRKATHRVTA